MPYKTLLNYFFGTLPLPQELEDPGELNRFTEFLKAELFECEYSKQMILLEPGRIANMVYFLQSGSVRGFKFDRNSKKTKTEYLWFEPALVTDSLSFIGRKESSLFIEVISSNAVLLSLSYDQIHHIFKLFPYAHSFSTNLLSQDLHYSNKELLSKNISAWEMLSELRMRFPQLDSLVRKDIIASFLNISPQHFSRINKQNIQSSL